MVFWQSHICFVLLLAFSGLNLIYSDCGTDVDRLNDNRGFCENRNLRRTDDFNYDKDLSRQRRVRDIGERRGIRKNKCSVSQQVCFFLLSSKKFFNSLFSYYSMQMNVLSGKSVIPILHVEPIVMVRNDANELTLKRDDSNETIT